MDEVPAPRSAQVRRTPRQWLPAVVPVLLAAAAAVLLGLEPAGGFTAQSDASESSSPAGGDTLEQIRDLEGVRSVLVSRRGELVVEWYAGGDSGPVNIKSASKSVLSALVGIAIERGHLEGVEQTVGELLPGETDGLPQEARDLTVHHLLSMTTGLASTSGDHYGAWVSRQNWVRAALERPVQAPPGERFTYSTGNSHVLSAILTRATGRPTREFAREALLEPLGIRIHAWDRSPQGIDFGGNNMAMTPRDLLAFGGLYLAGGRSGGRQVVPEGWVRRSTSRQAEGWPDRYGAYGYLWWLPPGHQAGAFMAVGFGGQFLVVLPQSNTVVVVTSTPEAKGAQWDRALLGILARGFGDAPAATD